MTNSTMTKMETILTQPIQVISLNKKATLSTITEDIGNHPETVMEEVSKSGLEAVGPMIFVYRNCTEDMSAPFDLEMTQPVKTIDGYQGKLTAGTLEPVKCLERTFKGSLKDLGEKGYMPFIGDIQEQGFQMTDQCREIYTQYESFESENNIVQLQMVVN